MLQIITGSKSVRHFHPIAVRPDNVIAVCWVDPHKVFIDPKWDEHVTSVTLKDEVVVGVDEDGNVIFAKQLLVTGHFLDISIDLGLDTTGQIAAEKALKNF